MRRCEAIAVSTGVKVTHLAFVQRAENVVLLGPSRPARTLQFCSLISDRDLQCFTLHSQFAERFKYMRSTRDNDSSPGAGRRQYLTVLFSDLSGSTRLGEQMEAEDFA